jgi:hypothetical protein
MVRIANYIQNLRFPCSAIVHPPDALTNVFGKCIDFFFSFLVSTGVETQGFTFASSRHTASWVITPAFFTLFSGEGLTFCLFCFVLLCYVFSQGWSGLWSSYLCPLSSWDYRSILPCLAFLLKWSLANFLPGVAILLIYASWVQVWANANDQIHDLSLVLLLWKFI